LLVPFHTLILFAALVLFLPAARAQDTKIVSMPKYISNCLYNFSRNISWPEQHRNGDFVIAIVGSKEVYTEMANLIKNMKVGQQSILVKYCATVNEMAGFQHMVFVADWQSSKISSLMQKLGGNSTLVVTESEGMISRGSMINFVPVNGVMKFEMSAESIKKNGLLASSTLGKLALNAN